MGTVITRRATSTARGRSCVDAHRRMPCANPIRRTLMRGLLRLAAVAAVCLAPSLAFAQASITGVVRDSSGAVLPGVTVEASSPALIERVRTVVSDAGGVYRI